MSNEQKLTKLLQIAVENGWENDLYQNHIMKHDLTLYPDILQLQHSEEDFEFLTSLNDLVLDWEEGQLSFIKALFKKVISDVEEMDILVYSYTVYFRNQWVNLPTSQRLEYLFTTFKYLL